MTYKESIDFLFAQLPMFSRVGAAAYKPGLDTSIALDDYFGNPHRRFKSIHVGGTNGKGSTSHMIASILQQQGFKVGLYTSPHLVDFRERIKINGEMITEKAVVDFVEKWRKSDFPGHPSFFELTMIMAFKYFADAEVDYAVIEVGMGGRLDSTNIIFPETAIITNISFDHTQFLGRTLPEIAAEKGGIIKTGVPVLIGKADGDVRTVFESKAAQCTTEINFASDSVKARFKILDDGTISVESQEFGCFISPLGGEYQIENINTVLNSIEILRKRGIRIENENVSKGIENVIRNTSLMGRWMITCNEPLTICDTGHNMAGLTHTLHQLATLMDKRLNIAKKVSAITPALRFVIGFVNDKDVGHIAGLLPRDAIYYVTQASVPRAMPLNELMRILKNHGLNCISVDNGVKAAYSLALEDSSENDIIYVGGSTFIVADYLS